VVIFAPPDATAWQSQTGFVRVMHRQDRIAQPNRDGDAITAAG
jgi:hypothetical protein